ncbi:ATP-binding cassette domain-containing protein [Streptomyces sp. NPDC090126]|uniref:ATP-binding cassette domain-containing protein n=1 Tax=Streptomyces sp. NPDC090126 TaxID=3365952 RepID=UPI003827F85F
MIDFLGVPSDFTDGTLNSLKDELMESIIQTTSLSQGYGHHQVISDLDLSIGSQVFGLLGPNGAGKTTLLRTLATVLPPAQGRVKFIDMEITSEKTARAARREIGYLPQDFGFYPNFSVYDFVHYCAWLREVPKKKIRSATLEAIQAVSLDKRKDAKMKSLSGGMLRRAGIATAIVGSPRLILLDEPTVGLDPAQRLEFRDLIRQLSDTAVVLSTHLVEDVAATCDVVGVLKGGQFAFQGSPADLAESATESAIGDNPLERGYMAVLTGEGAVSR